MTVKKSENACWSKCNFGDKRLTQRALYIGDCLRLKYGQALSTVFKNAGDLKRTYEFLANPKTSFEKVVEPSHYQTAKETKNLPLILSIGDTTFLDYKNIKLKREDYGPIGNGGNGLILHTSLAVAPDSGQPLGLLWEKVWKRTQKIKSGKKVNRAKVFEKKESYKWVEAIQKVSSIFQEVSEVEQPKVIHIFDREGDIAEVFAEVQRAEKCGFLVRAAHNRSLNEEENYLWNYVQNQAVSFEREISLTNNHKRKKRIAHLEVRFCQVKLRSPQRLKETNGFKIYAVYAKEINPLDGEEPINWMLLTTEVIESPESANTLLRWYTYRWLIEEYHKILKSGCQVESYRLGGNSMKVLLGFLTTISSHLLKITDLHRNHPERSATEILTFSQIQVLKALSSSKKEDLSKETIGWAIEAIARLGGYLEHRRKTPIGITVLWRGWLELMFLCKGWELREALS